MKTSPLTPNPLSLRSLVPVVDKDSLPTTSSTAKTVDRSTRAETRAAFEGLWRPNPSTSSSPRGAELDILRLLGALQPKALGGPVERPQQIADTLVRALTDQLQSPLIKRGGPGKPNALRFGPTLATGAAAVSRGEGHAAELSGRVRAGIEGQVDAGVYADERGVGLQGSYGVFGGAEAEVQGRFETDALQASGRARAAYEAYGQVDGRVGFDGLNYGYDLKAQYGAGVAAEAEGAFRTAGLDVRGQRIDINGQGRVVAEAGAFAEGEADVDIGLDGVQAELGASAFAGARAMAQAEVGIGDLVKVKGEAGAWAGIGVEGKANIAFKDGKLAIGLAGGVAKVVGAGYEGTVEIDVKEIGLTAASAGFDLASAPLRYALDPSAFGRDVQKLSDGIEMLAGFPGDVTEAVEGIASSVVQQIATGALAVDPNEYEEAAVRRPTPQPATPPPAPVPAPYPATVEEASAHIADSLLPLLLLALKLDASEGRADD
ncbi:MAG: hypothetical protein AAFU79_17075 [Myxococcota bacterium]